LSCCIFVKNLQLQELRLEANKDKDVFVTVRKQFSKCLQLPAAWHSLARYVWLHVHILFTGQ
jgi:hypothetical protein